ncbi:MAG: phospholipid/cholesterol/gamma-HCH transport system permease protein [Bacteroidia bacterium]|jgi:phospholipid/cholesterol/gamma-HCH transport system permease protein
MGVFVHIGRYVLWMTRVFRKPEKWSVFRQRIFEEIQNVGYASIGLVAIVSAFMGAVLTIQLAYNIDSPLIPLYTVGLGVRDSLILEFSPTIISIILAGKVGSSIAGEIGTMRVTDQIDALDIMGVNSTGYLVGPKMIAAVICNPFLVIMSMILGMVGGYTAGILTGEVSGSNFIFGIQYWFQPFYIVYALIKAMVFAVIITTVPAYFGYHTSGGALEVGRASTVSVVYSIVIILTFNLLLTQMLLQ